MEIVITHLGNASQLIPSTSVVNGIKKQNVNTNLTWVVEDESLCYINKYNKSVSKTIPLNKFVADKKHYHLLINLYPYFPENLKTNSVIKHFTGFCFHPDFERDHPCFGSSSWDAGLDEVAFHSQRYFGSSCQ